MTQIIRLSWILVLAALAAWTLVALSCAHLQSLQAARVKALAAAGAAASGQRASEAAISLADQTSGERQELAGLFDVDPVTLINGLTADAARLGVPLQISDVASEAMKAGSPANAFGFTASAAAGFDGSMRVLSAVESLPVPSSIERFTLSRQTASDPGSPWLFNVHVRVLTTDSISS